MIGAPGETRTPTSLRTTDFESAASTGSATGARHPSPGGLARSGRIIAEAGGRSTVERGGVRIGGVSVQPHGKEGHARRVEAEVSHPPARIEPRRPQQIENFGLAVRAEARLYAQAPIIREKGRGEAEE